LIAKTLALPGRTRQWAFDAMIGATAAFVAITAAQAALPDRTASLTVSHKSPTIAVVPAVVVEPAPAPALIAFSEPVPGHEVVSPFGLRKLPWEEGGRLHEGVDISAPAGLPVLAAADGVVTAFGVNGGYGRFVEVEHAEGLKTLYAHLGAIDKAMVKGLAIKAGAPIGAIGSSGTSTGPHLHFEVRDARDRPLNPKFFLDQRFATADDLPLVRAARVPRGVRIAQVSMIPESKKALMAAKAAKAKGKGKGAPAAADASEFGVEVAAVEARNGRKALIAQIAAAQKADMAHEGERPKATIAGAGVPAVADSTPAAVDGTATPTLGRAPA
jgi:hypothetical protein